MSNTAVATPPNNLNAYARDVTTQCGEDGIIAKVLEIIGDRTGWCVEFGAWDGKHYSNVYSLITNENYRAVLIEGDAERFRALQRNHGGNPRVLPVHALVGFTETDGLDTILSARDVPEEFDLLSIDIDGNDYHVWEAVQRYKPKVVLIEYNPTIPNAVEFVQPRDMRVMQGSSIRSLVMLAKRKGYELVATTKLNAFFVDTKYFPRFGIEDNSVDALRADDSHITYLFQGYDGTIFLDGFRRLNWHGYRFNVARAQQLPRWLRKYPDHYGRGRRILAGIFKRLRKKGIV